MSEAVGASTGAEGQVASDTSNTGAEQTNETTTSQAGADGQQAVSNQDKSSIVKDVINELGANDMDKIVTLKINGKEEKMPLKEALKISRLEKVSQAKMQEAAVITRKAQQLLQLAHQNPREFFQQTGKDPYEFAEATLAEKFEMMQLTPEQKRLMEAEQKLKQFEEREQNEKQTSKQREQQAQMAKMQGELENEIVEAWKTSGLPRHKYFAARISAEMLSSIAQKRAGYIEEPLNAQQAAAKVKLEVGAELKDILLSVAKTDPGAAQKMLGDDLMKILRDFDVQRVTGQTASKLQQAQANRPDKTSASGSKSTQPMSEKQWKEYFDKL